ncbi:MAG: tetratricopeptide repeat protein [Myxococcota bacterium]
MRSALFTVVLASTALAAPPRAAVTAFLPPSSSNPALQQLALLLEARASELVEETGKASELHLKQVVRAITEEGFSADFGDPANADALRMAVGADRAVAFSLEAKDDALVLSGVTVDGKKPKPFSEKLPKTWAGALDKGSLALAKAMLAGAPLAKRTAAQPVSTSDEALQQLGQCYPVVIRQSLSPETPALLDATELERASAACTKAVELDPKLRFAHAVNALAQAILGGDAAAARSLAALGDADDMLEVYSLARFWLLTRYQSNEAGVAFLSDVIKKRPGELIARAYLGDTQFALSAWADAEQTWRGYLERAPASPWAWARLSKALARQGKHDEAIAAARKSFALSPTSPETRLELASRLIDAGNAAEAKTLLEPLARAASPRGEHLLRLGWAHWVLGELDPAQAYFQRAVDVATAPGEWRTRGRAHYDLALVAVKQGRRDAAKAALKASLASGLKLRELDPSLAETARELERGEVNKATGSAKPALVPKEASLFPVDDYGEPDVKAKKPPAPAGLVLYRF